MTSLVRAHEKVVVSVGGVLGLRYARTNTVGSVLFKNSHAIRFTNRGEEVGRVVLSAEVGGWISRRGQLLLVLFCWRGGRSRKERNLGD